MRVIVRHIDVAIELGYNGITMEVRDNAGGFVGKLRLGSATVEWCEGKVSIGKGKMVPIEEVIDYIRQNGKKR